MKKRSALSAAGIVFGLFGLLAAGNTFALDGHHYAHSVHHYPHHHGHHHRHYDPYGYDAHGYNRHGYNRSGYHWDGHYNYNFDRELFGPR